MKTCNILIVDDDAMITSTLSKVVTIMLGQKVWAFNSPAEALEVIAREKLEIDLVISDFIMPEMNGIDFLKRFRQICPEAISILLTGYSDKQNAIASINEIGIFHYMEKPWDNDVLIHTIRNGLEKKRLKDDLHEKVLLLESRNLEIKQLYTRLEEEYRKETDRSTSLEAEVAERTASIRNLLDNAGQGFLSFGPNLKIDHDFSVECRHIFGKSIRNLDFAELIHPGDEHQQAFIRELAAKILLSEDEGIQQLYLPLLPDSIEVNRRSILIEYRIINRNLFTKHRKLMAILTDVTEKRELENRIEQEKNTLKMVVKAVTAARDYLICVAEFREFLHHGLEESVEKGQTPKEALEQIYREVHTLKGNFGMYNMLKTVECLHRAEDGIARLQELDGLGREELLKQVEAIDFSSGFDRDQAAIGQILGDSWFKKDRTLQVERATLVELENRMACLLSPKEFAVLIPDIRKMCHRKAGELFSAYLDHSMALAQRTGKMLAPISVIGEDIPIDCDHYAGFIRALIHVFRNSVIHGLELPEERLLKGKDAYGRITCGIKQGQDFLEFIIGDDGRGIDLEAVREKAVLKGLVSRDSARDLKDRDIAGFIFMDSFSTVKTVDLHSGRGMGLSAVKRELDKLNGSLKIETATDKGVLFYFIIPTRSEGRVALTRASDMILPAVDCAVKLIGECIGESNPETAPVHITEQMSFKLYDNTVFIHLKGQMEGAFFMTYDEDLSEAVLHAEMAETSEDSPPNLVIEALSEMTNTILGNCLGVLKELGDTITIDTPYTLSARDATLTKPLPDAQFYKISFKSGLCCVGVMNKG